MDISGLDGGASALRLTIGMLLCLGAGVNRRLQNLQYQVAISLSEAGALG